MKGKLKGKGPAAAVVFSLTALAVSLGGTSVAQVATSALSKKETKQVRKIANRVSTRKVRRLSPRLPASRANTAGFASNASNVAGLSVRKFFATPPHDPLGEIPPTQLASLGGLTLSATCPGPPPIAVAIHAASSQDGGIAVQPGNPAAAAQNTSVTPLAAGAGPIPVTSLGADGNRVDTFVFARDDGTAVVTGQYHLTAVNAMTTCTVRGTMYGG